MAKIRLFRYSGRPVDKAAELAYKADFEAFYDKAADRAGLDMLKLSRFMSFGERQLTKKHGAQVEIELPKTQAAFAKLVEEYQAPILIAATKENAKKLVLVIMDEGLA